MLKVSSLSSRSKTLLLAGVILFVIGVAAWLVIPESATNLSNYMPWGLYIAVFLLFESIAAGALFFGAWQKKAPVVGVGLAAALATGLAISFDLGSPLVAWRLLFTPNLQAPMILDVWFLGLNIIFGILLLIALRTGKAGLAKISAVGLQIVAVLLPLGTAWLFTTLPGKSAWGSSLEIAVFLVQAVLAGLLILQLFKAGNRQVVVGALLAVVFLNVAEAGLVFYGTGAEVLAMRALVFGSYAPLFWGILLIGFVLPLFLWVKNIAPSISVALVLVGIACSKYLYMIKGNLYPFVSSLGEDIVAPLTPVLTQNNGLVAVSYTPSIAELTVCLGAFGLALALSILLSSEQVADAGLGSEPGRSAG
jgi:molybdopterin-containing oxidoreductase family membrane subunit